MAKETKNQTASSGASAAPTIDITKLTPEQLQALQKQLKDKKKNTSGKTKERFNIIDRMLSEKDKKGEFVNTTRDILNALDSANLVDKTVNRYDLIEIKKIQARKQFLTKTRNEKGELIHPEGKFGYKPSEGGTFGSGVPLVMNFFKNTEKVAQLTPEQKQTIIAACS